MTSSSDAEWTKNLKPYTRLHRVASQNGHAGTACCAGKHPHDCLISESNCTSVARKTAIIAVVTRAGPASPGSYYTLLVEIEVSADLIT